MSFRKEKKYRLSVYEFNTLKNILIKSGMEKLHEPRLINSLYYDTESLEMYSDSEEGVLPRKKLRVRWYNSKSKTNIETKLSSIEGRFKTTKSLDLIFQDKFPRQLVDRVYGILKPSLLVTYSREYYIFSNMRITFDSVIIYHNKRIPSFVGYKDPERVMEIKVGFDISDDYINTLIPYPTSRFSKYSRGLLLTRREL